MHAPKKCSYSVGFLTSLRPRHLLFRMNEAQDLLITTNPSFTTQSVLASCSTTFSFFLAHKPLLSRLQLPDACRHNPPSRTHCLGPLNRLGSQNRPTPGLRCRSRLPRTYHRPPTHLQRASFRLRLGLYCRTHAEISSLLFGRSVG
jgi:hypothetical protein